MVFRKAAKKGLKMAKTGVSKVKPLIGSAASYAGSSVGGFLHKKTTIKRYKSGREVITEKQTNLSAKDIVLAPAGIAIGACGLIAAWGAYKFLNWGKSPLDDFKVWYFKTFTIPKIEQEWEEEGREPSERFKFFWEAFKRGR